MNKKSKYNFSLQFSKLFPDVNLGFSFRNLGYLPRWIILLLDIFIVIVSIGITFLLFKGLKLNYISAPHFSYAVVFYLIINVFFFWIFRTYSGIIRHSSYIDALKLFFSQFSTFLVLIIFNLIFIFSHKHKIYLTTGAFINAVLSFSFLFFYRIIVKQGFEKIFSTSNNSKSKIAIIYGSDANAIAVANALKSESPARFKLVGFIDKNNENSTKRILGLPIFQIKKTIPVLMRFNRVEALIIADKSLTKEERLLIVEECIEYGFKVYTFILV